MPIARLTRIVQFSASHRYFRPEWTAERNAEVFGDCANPNWHGHNYEVEVTVEGPVDPETGYVMDLKLLRDAVDVRVLQDVDHRNLNLDVPEFRDLNPTAENIAVVVWRKLEGALPGRLVKILLWETPRNCVEYRGE